MKTIAAWFILLIPMPWLLTSIATAPPAQDKKIPVPDEQSVERRDFMRTKLMYSQNIFEGLTIRDFRLIEQGIEEVERVLSAEQWVSIDSDDYRDLTAEFKTSLQRLKVTAQSKNIEATALRFYEMSTRCIDCHQHLRHVKFHF